jgi:hypothetical protein
MDRPGYKTTEFWVGVAGKLISLLIALRVISVTQGQDLLTAIGPAVTGIIAIGSIVSIVRGYTVSRTSLKQIAGHARTDVDRTTPF